MTFDPTKPVRFIDNGVDSGPAEILRTDLDNFEYPIAAVVRKDGQEVVESFTRDGFWIDSTSATRLVNIPEKVNGWVAVSGVFPTQKQAQDWIKQVACDDGRTVHLACLPVSFEEGEGLS